MTTTEDLQQLYYRARSSDDEELREQFLAELVSRHDPNTLEFHLRLLHDRSDVEFYLDLRAAYEDHGAAGERFLVSRISAAQDPLLRADMLLLLGLMNSSAARNLALLAVADATPEVRENAMAVLGWLGDSQDLPILVSGLLADGAEEVRADAAGAMCQVWYRLPETKADILQAYLIALEREPSETVLRAVTLSAQTLLKARFGMRIDDDTGEIVGDYVAARSKALKRIADHLRKGGGT